MLLTDKSYPDITESVISCENSSFPGVKGCSPRGVICVACWAITIVLVVWIVVIPERDGQKGREEGSLKLSDHVEC